ncbi:MAG TPA: hypothetical protein VMA77_10130 [Solirubrobacteraceae bacterium]|nr:hypothetical protein [Solirubrobacteraceae bacterium]
MALKFSGCMRSHGLPDFPDPTVGSNGLPSWTLSARTVGANPQSPGFRAARQACGKDLPDLGLQTPVQKATANAEALKYASCMRTNGVPNFPDPNGQGVIQITNATGTLDPSSPQYQKAETACKALENGFGEQSSGAASSAAGSAGNS